MSLAAGEAELPLSKGSCRKGRSPHGLRARGQSARQAPEPKPSLGSAPCTEAIQKQTDTPQKRASAPSRERPRLLQVSEQPSGLCGAAFPLLGTYESAVPAASRGRERRGAAPRPEPPLLCPAPPAGQPHLAVTVPPAPLRARGIPRSSPRGIKAPAESGAAQPTRLPPPAPAMSPHLRLILLLAAAAALCRGKRPLAPRSQPGGARRRCPAPSGARGGSGRAGAGGCRGGPAAGAQAAPPAAGAPLAGELRCRCVRTVSELIPPRRLARVELIAEGPHCAVPEVM